MTQLFLLVLSLNLGCAQMADGSGWHHPLYLGGAGYWRQRICLVIDNRSTRAVNGEPVTVVIGSGPGEAALAGARAQSVRVCTEQGVEVLFALWSPDGTPITRGPIPAASVLTIPAVCPAGRKTACYAYFDNPCAGEVPDFLPDHLCVINGDVEQGRGTSPTGWVHDEGDEQHRASWSTEQPQSGRRCLKTVVAPGSEPTWISTRQRGISIRGGARYRMRAWVRADHVKGNAGWYIHVGNDTNPMIISPMLNGGEGTFGWKQVAVEFTAPAEAHTAGLGTVLRGTGTAWFDNVSLQCLEPSQLQVVAERPEICTLKETGGDMAWYSDPRHPERPYRTRAQVIHFASHAEPQSLVSLDLAPLAARRHGHLDRQSLVVTFARKPLRHYLSGDQLLFKSPLAARSLQTYEIYFSDDASARDGEIDPHLSLAGSDRNLVRNGDFTRGRDLPDGWQLTGRPTGESGVVFGLADPGPGVPFQRCVRMHVPEKVPSAWRGWTQTVPVRPGQTYLLAAWVKCQGVQGGEVRVHGHRRTAAGQLCRQEAMVSLGPGIHGKTGWTRMSGLFTMPEDVATFQIHLTMNQCGTVWHGGIALVEVVPATHTFLVQSRAPAAADRLCVWPVSAVVKVFPNDEVPRMVPAARIFAARNEKEPLQLAVRSPTALHNVHVEVVPPEGPHGARLNDLAVHVVGYVPVDHPTSYYQSRSPAWQRKYPRAPGQCDGWPGLWPDPLLPRSTFDLAAASTQPIWITVRVGKNAPAGDYRGLVRLIHENYKIAEVPFTVHVWDFALPDETRFRAIYDVSLGPGASHWQKSLAEARAQILPLLAEHRLCPDRIQPSPIFRYKDGRASADFTAFDRAADHYFNELKLPHSYMPEMFYLFGWGFPPKPLFGEHPYPSSSPYPAADRSRLRPEYKKAYQSCLKLFWDHVKHRGWDRRFVLYISDEPFQAEADIRQQMKALCAMIHEVDSAIPIYASTWQHVPEWDGFLNVWGLGHYGNVSTEKLAQLQARGDRVWFTTDGQMCLDTPYCAVERLLPHYCFKYGLEAYEFWSVGWLTYDPFRFGWHAYIHQSDTPTNAYWVRYPNGDGYLIYPGPAIGQDGPVSTIRLEQAREGVEDYEYLCLLRSLVDRARSAGRDSTAAGRALQAAAALVSIPNAGGCYSTRILPRPAAVDEVKQSLGTAIEQLSR